MHYFSGAIYSSGRVSLSHRFLIVKKTFAQFAQKCLNLKVLVAIVQEK
jgi:hypothetical protein